NSNPMSSLAGLDLFFHQTGTSYRVGMLDMKGDNIIKSGQQRLFELEGEFVISDAVVSDMNFNAISPVITSAGKTAGLPGQFRLDQNYPNPFNPTTEIVFSIPQDAKVSLEVFNIMGQRVKTLIDEMLNAGEHTVEWDSRNSSGQSVSSGIYFYKLNAGDQTDSKKMMLLK
ncbi:MAG: T9SS type A sorting domain-containing protein, partial [bacterium]